MYCSSSKVNKVPKEKLSHESALELAKFLVKRDTSWDSDVSSTDEKVGKQGSPNSLQPVELGGITPLFLATKSGCIEIVKEILEIYPQAVEHIDNEGRTILHVAIKYRQLEVFKLVLDNNGNSILHMVGIKRDGYVPEKMRGPALELQEEMLWFERVKSITKAHFIDHRNNNKDTAEGLFATTNINLRNEAREWLRHTAGGCSIVAVLIATVAFAAAYTIPGGPNQSTGVPVLLYQPFFVVFTAIDVLSLASALTSVVIFLSILLCLRKPICPTIVNPKLVVPPFAINFGARVLRVNTTQRKKTFVPRINHRRLGKILFERAKLLHWWKTVLICKEFFIDNEGQTVLINMYINLNARLL
ncbi:ankyrin repeat-containing protein At5g02620-like isoform X4 [Fagus crenata]